MAFQARYAPLISEAAMYMHDKTELHSRFFEELEDHLQSLLPGQGREQLESLHRQEDWLGRDIDAWVHSLTECSHTLHDSSTIKNRNFLYDFLTSSKNTMLHPVDSNR